MTIWAVGVGGWRPTVSWAHQMKVGAHPSSLAAVPFLDSKKVLIYCCVDREHTRKCLSIGTPNTTIFPFVPNGKRWLLGVPIFEYIIFSL